MNLKSQFFFLYVLNFKANMKYGSFDFNQIVDVFMIAWSRRNKIVMFVIKETFFLDQKILDVSSYHVTMLKFMMEF